nr:NAD-dependent epimerase/dehydratase family protein [Saprospiraceae bacterium]
MKGTPKVLVTGANSLLGTHVIRELLHCGYAVRGLLRNVDDLKVLPDRNLETFQGDFTELEVVEKAVLGCDYIIHIAAVTDPSLLNYREYERVNTLAVEQLIAVAGRSEVKKFVFVSTANVFGYGDEDDPGHEEMPMAEPYTDFYYAMSKAEAHQLIFQFTHSIEVVAVNPTFMLGDFDSKPSSGRIITMAYKKRWIFCPPGGKNFIHVRDAAYGTVRALEVGESGESYLLTGENLSYRDFYLKLMAYTGQKSLLISPPVWFLYALGMGGDLLRLLGIKIFVSLINMRIVCVKNFYRNDKAVEELGLKCRPIEKGIEDAVQWFKKEGMLK